MKKLSLLVLSFLFLSNPLFALDGPPAIGEIKGVRGGRQAEPSRVYKLVRFANRGADVASIEANDVVVYDTVSDDAVTVRLTTTSADGAIAGIAVTTIQTADSSSTSASDDETKRNWGYIVIHGPATAKASAAGTNGASIGDPFITSSDSGAITTYLGNLTSLNTTIVKQSSAIGGFFLDAGDTSTTGYDVFVKLE